MLRRASLAKRSAAFASNIDVSPAKMQGLARKKHDDKNQLLIER
jgi:hypothetical protein